MNILEEIRRILLPEIIRLEDKIQSLESSHEKLFGAISKLQDELQELKDRVLKLEVQFEGIEERIAGKLILNLLKFRQLPNKDDG